MRELYWFQNDLRLTDNPGLLAHSDADRLLLVYAWPEPPPWCNLNGIGAQRARFLAESLSALRRELQLLGQDLLVLRGDPVSGIAQLVREMQIHRIGTTPGNGSYEREQLRQLQAVTGVSIAEHDAATLFSREDLSASGGKLAKQFTPFSQQVQSLPVGLPLPAPKRLPVPPEGVAYPEVTPSAVSPHPSMPLRGGSADGLARLQAFFFDRRLVLHYKDTRNHLDTLDGSSLFSPWLANGGLSVRTVAEQLRLFEHQVVPNESTAWLFKELLWREFFHWRAQEDGAKLFAAGGIRGKKQLRTFDARSFARWCKGDTDYSLVNALMRQLVATGWMSNRGRQIAASCLINELDHDWRFGAAFFEQHLIDFDVASNYGNWQYIAGVGTDPRGGRHFNLERQAQTFDPDGRFTAAWDGMTAKQPRFVTDAADWPMQP